MATLFYEDLVIGSVFTSGGRTVTEPDNTFFSMMSGDWSPIHANAEFSKSTRFGRRIVPGLFGLSLVTGAVAQWGIFEQSAVALLNVRSWDFKAPIFIGDTITITMEIMAARLTSRGDVGIVERRFDLRRHDGATVQTGLSDMMIARRPALEPAAGH